MYKNNNRISLLELANCVRILSAEAVEKAKSGHPGMPLGMADVMTVLAANFLRFNPNDPKWFNRDRLILSAGHGSMLLYSFYYLAGYKDFTLDQIKSFRQFDSICAGHPEYGMYPAIETTTGPLGQGIANSVGMAIAQKKYQAKFGQDFCGYKIYCIAGDGCLMEGISYEAMSLAGHLKLDNLIIIFDDNGISIDGSTKLAVSEDHLQKFAAMGFFVQSIDGHDHQQINTALEQAKLANKPSFIACKTVIAKGANHKAGTEKSHGAPLGQDEINHLRQNIGFGNEEFYIPETHLSNWRQLWQKNAAEYEAWQNKFAELSLDDKAYINTKQLVVPEQMDYAEQEATRVSSGKVLEKMLELNDKLIIGSADLAESNNVWNKASRAINKDDFSGNFIHFGVREHAMAAICNGLALSGFNAVCATFFVFSDYMRPAIRLSAIMGLPVIYVMTHDSIGVGEDGPTHQPVEHLASLRAMPNIDIYRPADSLEVLKSYHNIAANQHSPSMLVLTRQALPDLHKGFRDVDVSKGAYIIKDANAGKDKELDYVIYASGSELQIALQVAEKLGEDNKSVRVVSVLSMDLLLKAGREFIAALGANAKNKIAIEAGVDFGWHRFIGEKGRFFGMENFGHSAPASVLFKHYGIDAEVIYNNTKEMPNLS